MTAGVSPNPDVVARRLDDSIVLVNLETNRIFTLNTTGGRIWELLSAGSSAEEIETVLEAEFDVQREQAGVEVASLVEKLLGEGLVVPPPGGRTGRR